MCRFVQLNPFGSHRGSLKSRYSFALSVPSRPTDDEQFSESNIERFINGRGRARTWLGLQFIHKVPCNRESSELVARFNPAYSTDAVKPGGAWHLAEGRQDKFDLHFYPYRRNLGSEYKHSTHTNVHAVSSVVVAPAVGPAE
jgi:hypothetical protein